MSLETVEKHASFAGEQGVYKHQSEATACEMEFSVYVPPQASAGPVPVLYYLSGLTCTQDNVTTKAGFQKYAAEHGLIIVCPDTSPRGSSHAGEHDNYDFGSGAGFYLDATLAPWSENYNMYSYIVDELPAIINKHFPTNPEQVGVLGHSMGGHGALVIALRNADRYQSVSAFSPIVTPTQVPWGQNAFAGYLGADESTWQQYDATQLIKSGHRTPNKILIDQGTGDDFLQTQLRPDVFEQACQTAGQGVEVRMQTDYDHSYYFIASFMQDHIAHHAAILNSA